MISTCAFIRSPLFRLVFTVFFVFVATAPSVAEDLWTVYFQAASTSPTLARARSLLEADQATLPLARSGLMPHLSAGAGVGRDRLEMDGFGQDFGLPLPKIEDSFYDSSYSVTLTQPILNGQAWAAVRVADARIRAGQAAVLAAQQDLILDVADAYFSVLRAAAEERVIRSQKELLQTILAQTEAALKVGTGDVIAVEEARASEDAVNAALIRAENSTRIAKQRLERLTHQPFGDLVDLPSISPEGPNPDEVNPWLEAAKENQPILAQAREQLQMAQDQIEVERRARWPRLNLGAGFNHEKGSFLPSLESNKVRVGVNLSLPLYEGGEIGAKTRIAEAQARATEHHLKNLEDQVILNTQSSFLILRNSVSELQAAEQALTSGKTSLSATRKGYEIGSRSVVDLLKVAHDYQTAQLNYYIALYNQVLSRLKLKAAAGVLSEEDIKAVNGLLQR